MAWTGVALVEVVTGGFEFRVDFEARVPRFRDVWGREERYLLKIKIFESCTGYCILFYFIF